MLVQTVDFDEGLVDGILRYRAREREGILLLLLVFLKSDDFLGSVEIMCSAHHRSRIHFFKFRFFGEKASWAIGLHL